VRATFARPPAEVRAAITDRAAQPGWRNELESLAMPPPRDGRTAFREVGPCGPANFIVDESTPASRHVVRILDEELGYGGRWIHELEPAGSGARLTITEEGEVKGVVFRAMPDHASGRRIASHSSSVRGQSSRRSCDSARSASTRPPVWQRAQ